MIPVSSRFIPALGEPHKICTSAELWKRNLRTKKDEFICDVQVTSGSVQVDKTSQFRRQSQNLVVIVDDPKLVPVAATSRTAPNGVEIKLFRGIDYQDGTTETVPLGVLGLSVTQANDTGHGLSLAISAYDRSRRVSRALFTKPMLITSGASCVNVIATILLQQCPWLSENDLNFSVAGQLNQPILPPLYYQLGDDPWLECMQLATACGGELFFDAFGLPVLRELPNVATAPALQTYKEGNGNQMIALSPMWDDQYVVNTWLVEGNGSFVSKVTYVAQDMSPSSPTSVPNYGEAAQKVQTGLVTIPAQAQAMGKGLLTLSSGLVNSAQFQSIVNPAFEPDDVIDIERSVAVGPNGSRTTLLTGKHALQSFDLPLTANTTMSGQTREVAST